MAKRKKTTEPVLTLPSMQTLKVGDLISRRWDEGLPETADYYYDEPPPATKLTKKSGPEDFPPDDMDLSDRWVVAVIESQISHEDRARRWPAAFSQKGLRATYAHKGQSSKGYDGSAKIFKYTVIFGRENMIGEEGAAVNLPERTNAASNSGNQTELGLVAQIQSTDYDYDEATKKSAVARKKESRKRPAAKTDETPRKRRDRKEPEVKEPEVVDVTTEESEEEDDEDDDEEELPVVIPIAPRTTRSGKVAKETPPKKKTPVPPRKKHSKASTTEPKEAETAPTLTVKTSMPASNDDWAAAPDISYNNDSDAPPPGSLQHIVKRDTNQALKAQLTSVKAELQKLKDEHGLAVLQLADREKELDEALRERNATRPVMASLLTRLRESHSIVRDMLTAAATTEMSEADTVALEIFVNRNQKIVDVMWEEFPKFAGRVYAQTDAEFKLWVDSVNTIPTTKIATISTPTPDTAKAAKAAVHKASTPDVPKTVMPAPVYKTPTKPLPRLSPKKSPAWTTRPLTAKTAVSQLEQAAAVKLADHPVGNEFLQEQGVSLMDIAKKKPLDQGGDEGAYGTEAYEKKQVFQSVPREKTPEDAEKAAEEQGDQDDQLNLEEVDLEENDEDFVT